MVLPFLFTMYEDFIWFIIILSISLILSNLLFRHYFGPFETMINVLAFFGVLIHEISHFIMCKILNVPTDGFHIKYRFKGQPNPHGSVSIKEIQRISFLQATLVALALLLLSTWLIFWLFSVLLTFTLDPLFIILGFFMCFSLLLGAAPSNTDFKQISRSFNRDPFYSFYQLILAIISGLIVWGISIIYPIAPEFTIANYCLIGIFYFMIKYSLIIVNKHLIHGKKLSRNNGLNYKSLTRRRIKAIKPYKIGFEEAQW